MKCKKCNKIVDEKDTIIDRNGDPYYDHDTNFCYRCPYCLEPIKEKIK